MPPLIVSLAVVPPSLSASELPMTNSMFLNLVVSSFRTTLTPAVIFSKLNVSVSAPPSKMVAVLL